jgi:hypothetical protein
MKVDKIVLYLDMFIIIYLRSMNIIDKMIINRNLPKEGCTLIVLRFLRLTKEVDLIKLVFLEKNAVLHTYIYDI